jgi:hypothetical protein
MKIDLGAITGQKSIDQNPNIATAERIKDKNATPGPDGPDNFNHYTEEKKALMAAQGHSPDAHKKGDQIYSSAKDEMEEGAASSSRLQ